MEEIIAILSKMHPNVDFASNKHLIDNQVLDSFDIISLVTELNKTFDIKIKAADLKPANFNSVEAIDALVNKLMDE